MPSPRAHIEHHFGGGWATDFGPHVPGLAPDQSGNLVYPYLVNADDCFYDLDGGPVTADGTFLELAAGLPSDAVPNMSQFDDLLILADDSTSSVPRSWDGTTFQNLAGSPPNFSFSVKHLNFHFAAGALSSGSTLFYSNQLNPEDWSGGGTIQIDPNDGDIITGIVSHHNQLLVFKGPNKGSIHRITGNSAATWAREQIVDRVGAVWQNSICKFRDDIAFLWSDGTIRSLNTTERFG